MDDTQIDWWKVDVYWGDERCVPLDHEDSNYRLARESLLDRVGAANATYPMRCDEGPDPYQLRIGELGKLDVIHLGLGPDGHTASLFPGSAALDADPGRLVVMNEDPLGNNKRPRMTLTFAGIARARLVLFTVAGDGKRDAFQRLRRRRHRPPRRARDRRPRGVDRRSRRRGRLTPAARREARGRTALAGAALAVGDLEGSVGTAVLRASPADGVVDGGGGTTARGW